LHWGILLVDQGFQELVGNLETYLLVVLLSATSLTILQSGASCDSDGQAILEEQDPSRTRQI